jgi:hypothetical protein
MSDGMRSRRMTHSFPWMNYDYFIQDKAARKKAVLEKFVILLLQRCSNSKNHI